MHIWYSLQENVYCDLRKIHLVHFVLWYLEVCLTEGNTNALPRTTSPKTHPFMDKRPCSM